MTELQRNSFLKALENILWDSKDEIIEANNKDLVLAKKKKLARAFLQRLTLDEKGIKEIIFRLKRIAQLQSGVGQVIEQKKLKDDLVLRKVRTSLGIILVIYEARPEVTIDAAALCIKSGNKVILKGGSEAIKTNKILFECIQKALAETSWGKDWVKLISSRSEVKKLIQNTEFVDLVIARGGYDLVSSISKISKVPLLAHSAGGARIYIDESADLKMALSICLNAKLSKTSACNSLDTIVLHEKIAASFLNLISQNKEIEVIDSDYETEFLSSKLSIKIVENVSQALEFIQKYSKGHSEGIIAQDEEVIEKFIDKIDSAALFINCSTRLHDGYVFGMGAEMGIATGKLHARGPVGLQELTTYKWVLEGQGNLR